MFQGTNDTQVTTSTTSIQAIGNAGATGLTRTQIIICNVGASIVTIRRGETAAIQNQGIVLNPTQNYVEATDGGYTCYQGAVQVISNAAGSVAISEGFVSL